MTDTEDPKKKMAVLREQLEKIQASREAESDARELQELELVVRFEQEIGARGREFELVSTPDGPIVVKRGEFVLYKKFQASMKGSSEPTPEAVFAYVSPSIVYPDKETFNRLVDAKPYYAVRCASAQASLHGAKSEADRGKF